MIEHAKRWISGQLSLGEFSTRRSVLRRSLIMAVRIAIIAYTMNVLAHLVLYATGLLPYGLLPALVLATCLTPPVSFIVASIAYYVVGMAVFELSVSHREFERISRTDALSGLLNRRAFMDAYDKAASRSALILFDIDRFKTVNDLLGHAAGDAVIVAVAEDLAAAFADGHIVSRFGGEEFAVLVIGLAAGEVRARAERARSIIGSRPLSLSGTAGTITVSAGIADCRDHPEFSTLFSAADRALYLAKASGRDRVMHEDDLLSLDPMAQAEKRRSS